MMYRDQALDKYRIERERDLFDWILFDFLFKFTNRQQIYHGEAASDVQRLTHALHAKGLACVSNSAAADTILIYITFAYIAPGSPTMAEAAKFLQQKGEKLVIPIFGGLSSPAIKQQAKASGWDDEGILRGLTHIMGIDKEHRGLSLEILAGEVKDHRARSMRSPQRFDIFLSHAGEDKEFVRVLRAKLQTQYRCFLDERSIDAGKPGIAQLKDAAARCRLALFVLSDRSIKKRWPVRELRIFKQNGVPIFVVWYKLLREQVEQYACNPPRDLLQNEGAKEFLEEVLYRSDIKSIHYDIQGWNNPNNEEYSQRIQRKLNKILAPN
ncbi:hypothetical protein KP509_32G004500 [Ceratopteris richardii]|uniref:TIR domain-containing protein n=1 Tax=Ceratopteris richardii TaxID=49495 RepID=A0A8T2QS05_CERRI|nr:hypothetical protein KP509_32G004500 [Ceratopteris richardii]